MKKKTLVLGCVILLLVLVVGSAVLWAIVPRVGYCFGTALSESEDHLFVSAGYRGLHTFYITPEGDLVHVSTTYDEGYYRYVEVMGDVVYVANSQRGLMVFDVSSGEPTPVWAQTGAKAYGIHLVPPLAFVAAEDQGLAIFDLSLHQEPMLLGRVATPGRAWDVWTEGKFAFVADADRGLVVVDVSSSTSPQIVSSLSWGTQLSSGEIIDGRDGFVYIAAADFGLLTVDVTDPLDPAITDQYDPGPDSYGESVSVSGDFLYASIQDGVHAEENGIHIFDIQNPSLPVLIGRVPIDDFVEGIAVRGTRLAIANTNSGVLLYDVRAPQDPKLLDCYPAAIWRVFTRHIY